jgi:O-antigen/teichoic acid export membrane protein
MKQSVNGPRNRESKVEISGNLLARNTMLNFGGRVASLLVGVVTIPFIIQGLGTERFGLLSLAWVVLGYFTIFDLGLGRATTKFVAEVLGKGEESQVPYLVWTAVTIQALFGLIGALVLVSITPLLVKRIFNIPLELMKEAKDTFYLLSLAIPLVLIAGSFSGVLQAAQRFDFLNIVKIPSSALIFLLPLLGLFLGFRLPGIIALIVASKLVELIALLILNFRIFPSIKRFSAHSVLFLRLLTYGGWVMSSSIVSPILVYLDRFLIAMLLSITALAYYTAPYEVVIRLLIIPTSLTIVLFPAFSMLEGIEDRRRLEILFARSVKYSLLALGPIVFILVLFSEEILQVWLGADFAIQSAVVLQILALGVLVNSLARSPLALLQGVGQPDIPAKFHFLELPLHIGIAWILVNRWGITGAAVAWTLRVAFDALLLFAASFKVCQFSPRLLVSNGVASTAVIILFLTGVSYKLKCLTQALPLVVQYVISIILVGFFVWVTWGIMLDASERKAIVKAIKPRRSL